jgi:hypothetical protein
VQRGDDVVLTPDPDHVLAPDDRLLLAGRSEARSALGSTLVVHASSEYVLTGRRRAVGWVWRRLSGASTEPPSPPASEVEERSTASRT